MSNPLWMGLGKQGRTLGGVVVSKRPRLAPWQRVALNVEGRYEHGVQGVIEQPGNGREALRYPDRKAKRCSHPYDLRLLVYAW